LIIDLSKDGKFGVISAFKAHPSIDLSAALSQVRATIRTAEVQLFDGERIAGREHLEIAAINALHAFKNGLNVSRTLAMETLLYASAQRQIEVAIRSLGVDRESRTVGIVAFSETKDEAEKFEAEVSKLVQASLDDSLLDDWSDEKTRAIIALYEIKSAEVEAIRTSEQDVRNAVGKAVVERVALLSTKI